MTDNKGLTGINEIMRGFVGTRGLSAEPTKAGRSRIRFDLCRGNTDLSKMEVATWRHCVGYDLIAEKLKDIKAGELIKVEGYVVSEIKRDYTGKPYFLPGGEPVVEDVIFINSALRINYQGKQYKFFEDRPSGADNRMVEVPTRESVNA